jgi:hypothetical protein
MKKYSWILVVAAMGPLFPLACGGGTTSTTSTGSGGGSGGGTTTGTPTTTTTGGMTTTTTGGMTTTTAGGGGAGGGVATIAACDAPVTAPSMGKCYMSSGTSSSSSAASSSAASTSAASSSAATGSSSAATGSSSTGGGPDCSKFFNPGACGTCAEANCCSEIAVCKGNPDCLDCITGNDPTKCVGAAQMQTDAVNNCTNTKCNAECVPPSCNPITNEGCSTDTGEACDHTPDGFGCFPAPNDTPICEACDNQAGPFCEAGHTCLPDGGCAAFCCDDGDCGANGKCDTTVIKLAEGGVCVKK